VGEPANHPLGGRVILPTRSLPSDRRMSLNCRSAPPSYRQGSEGHERSRAGRSNSADHARRRPARNGPAAGVLRREPHAPRLSSTPTVFMPSSVTSFGCGKKSLTGNLQRLDVLSSHEYSAHFDHALTFATRAFGSAISRGTFEGDFASNRRIVAAFLGAWAS
jgi:hypothetical protein